MSPQPPPVWSLTLTIRHLPPLLSDVTRFTVKSCTYLQIHSCGDALIEHVAAQTSVKIPRNVKRQTWLGSHSLANISSPLLWRHHSKSQNRDFNDSFFHSPNIIDCRNVYGKKEAVCFILWHVSKPIILILGWGRCNNGQLHNLTLNGAHQQLWPKFTNCGGTL